jgi:small neutral amino acid transporter SnatA (MarC family)
VTVSFTSASQATAGESGTATITAQLSAVSGQDVTVPFTVNVGSTATGGGTDYSITASPIVITAGNTTADITVTISADSLDENNETVIVDMGTPTNAAQGAITTHTVTITDDDASPTVTFTSASQSTAGESGTATITAQLSAVSGLDVTVPFTINGSSTATGGGTDYSITASPITITAGNTTANITITIATDSLDENNETVVVDMGTPTNATQGATTAHTLTITDDDAEPAVTFTSASQATANESGTPTITAQLSAISGRNVTVPFTINGSSTATGGGTDYSITASPITITAGNTTADITVTITADSLDESNETVIVDMGTPTNATQGAITTHTLTITDDDEAGGTIYTVCKAGHADAPCNYQSINGGIDSASVLNGDNLLVSADTYSENINFDGKNITIQSKMGAASTIIQGDGTNNPVVKFITAETSTAVLDGFTIDNQAAGNTLTRGIYISGASPTIKNSTIQGNNTPNTTDGGGGVYVDNSSPSFDNVTIRANTSLNRSGCGMYIKGAAGGATITNSTIGGTAAGDGNLCTNGSGGGIYYTESTTGTLLISNSNIQYNQGNANGGGIFATTITNQITITNTTVLNNFTGTNGDGGGIYIVTNTPLSFTGGSVSNNISRSGVGFLVFNGADLTISGGTVINNNDTNNCTSGDGGGIYATSAGTTVSMTDGSITNNASRWGSGVYVTSSAAVTLTGVTINSNSSACGTNNGGGIHANGGTLTADRSKIRGNSGLNGGGIYAAGSATVTIKNSDITGNVATTDGGGAMVTGTTTLNIYNSTVAGNYSGGASNGGGGVRNNTATLNITNGIVYGNTAAAGASKAGISTSGTTNINYSSYQAISGTCTSCANNRAVGENPLLVNLQQAGAGAPTTAGDFHLTATSPVINQGTNNGYTPDIDGDTRPQSVVYDMGSDEYVP